MPEGADAAGAGAHLHAVGGVKRLSGIEPAHGLQYGKGIVQRAEGVMQVLKPAAVSLAPMLSAKQLPSSTILSDSLKGCCAESAMTGVMSFIIGAKILNLLTV